MTVVINAIAVDGLSNLLGARRAYGALVFIKPQAALFKGQATVVQQTTNFAFRVINHLFIEHTMDSSG